ncbi:glycosyltransferase family 1 protein [Nordella sp. HKS 07]|uniref:glycosyltransferase family 1 protein n=1 Tax=Nordella sp. HKS 07 TaxID=2712222 RepID=UPI0013E106E8|nr:glycosyltransferase family 1 protein [Nordella sp. HKS 07]QIG46415.1 glycosyltransferase family 1 protein [Nordella sp. HKS 07]
MRRARHVLLCWEFGGGHGHVRRLKSISDQLQARGFTTAYGLRRPEAGLAIGIALETIRPAPNWPLRPAAAGRGMTSATYGDYLAQLMLRPHDDLDERFRLWHDLIEREQPDLVIADYAPSVSLLCHERVSVVAIGDGYTLPPPTLDSFPRLIEDVPIEYDESDVVRRINAALSTYDRTPITRYPLINRADQHHLLTFPFLDPYRDQRAGGWLGTADTRGIILQNEAPRRLFSYFHESRQTDARLVDGLVQSGLPGKAIFSSPLRRTVKKLEAAGIETPDGLADLATELAASGVLVHQGSGGMTMAGIAAGLPQVMLRSDLEKTLNAKAIVARHAGIVLGWSSFVAQDLARAIREAAESPAMRDAARQLSRENEAYLQLDAAAEIANACESLLAG